MNENKYTLESGEETSLSSEREGVATKKVGMKKNLGMQRSHFIFYVSIVAFPVLQFLVFFIYMNLNSFILAFQRYDYESAKYVSHGFQNFKDIFRDFAADESMRASVKNSLILFVFNLVFSNFGTIVFSYYIYKNHFGSKMFKIILYAPHIVSTMVVVIMYQYFVDAVIPKLWFDLFDKSIDPLLLPGSDTQFPMILFFAIWVGFGTQVLVYSGTMSGISDSVIESARLDGITPVKELFFIVIPMVWPTTITFIVSAIAGIFTNQMHLFSFCGENGLGSGMETFGYLLYARVQKGTMADYTYLSALGLLMTCVAAPLTLIIRRLMEKYGPSTN